METSSAVVDNRSASRATSDGMRPLIPLFGVRHSRGSRFFKRLVLVLVVVCICKFVRCHDLEPKQNHLEIEWFCSETVLGIREVAISFGYFIPLNEQSVNQPSITSTVTSVSNLIASSYCPFNMALVTAIFFLVALRPSAGHDLIFNVSRSHTTTHHSW